MSENPLHLLMNPRSIAVAGAGNNFMKMGTLNALSIVKDSFPGRLYPVHPREKTVLGLPAFATVADLPETPDLAVLIVPADQALVLMDEFGKRGTRRAIVISAGFRETGPEGVLKERALVETARRHSMRFVGPNCMGILNTGLPLNTTVAAMDPAPGKLGFASQSGTYVAQVLPYLQRRGIRFSKALSVGNEADITLADVLEYLGEDEQTKAISLYVEGIGDVERFLAVARKITPCKPVIAQYIGGSEAGARAGKSHTGAMAGPDYLYEGLFRQAGIIRVHSVEDLYGIGWALASQPPIRGTRIGIVTNSGGPGSAVAHTCETGGFTMPRFSDALQEKIRPLIPPHAPCINPVDVTFMMDINLITDTIPEMLMKSGEVDGIVLHGAMRSGFIAAVYPHLKELINDAPLESILGSLGGGISNAVRLPFTHGIPMAVSSFFGCEDDYSKMYMDSGVPVFDSPEKAAHAMNALLRHYHIRNRAPHRDPALPAECPAARRVLAEARAKGRTSLDEHAAKTLLAAYGVSVTAEKLVDTAEGAAAAADTLGYPVVLKACDAEILHKTEKGLVFLNLRSRGEAAAAFTTLQERAGRQTGAVIYKMVMGERELIAGMTRHPGFGPCVVFGLGGIYTEALRDLSFRVAPLSERDAREMQDEIRASKVLGEFRRMPAVNRDALTAVLMALSAIAVLHPEVAEIDINPLLVSGSNPVAVDALVVLADPTAGQG